MQTIVYFSANSSGVANFSKACDLITASGGRLTSSAWCAADVSNDHATAIFLTRLRQSENLTLLVRLHGGKASCPCFDAMIEAAGAASVFIDAQNVQDLELARAHFPHIAEERGQTIATYMRHDGRENWRNLLLFLTGQPAEPPCPQPTEGLYHPRVGISADLVLHCERLGWSLEDAHAENRPVVGLWFFPTRWLDGDLAHVDALIDALERQGCLPICCFYKRTSGTGGTARDTRWVRDHYFCRDGQPLIHVLINLMCFSLSLIRPDEAHLLGELDIPVLHAMELFADYEAWSTTRQGVSPLDVCANFAQPEFDGYLSTVPVATREQEQDPRTGTMVPCMRPITDRITKVARMAVNWARLRLKPNNEKKIAVIFHNYPPRNDAIGTALGLDTFQSVHNLLQRMEREGYLLEQQYADAQELAERMIAGLTSDSRWLTPEAMTARAADKVAAAVHTAWSQELPAVNAEELTKDWGKAPGKLFVHQQHVLINGVINGNVYLGVQPPRGHIEQPNKLHDPNLAPSYHYLYYYRWLRDIFKADAVIHMGTHGSLEWLPGKSAGMSRECYTDLALGELPNIYPYIINIPSEGTQTKRRSFSCLVDHLIPVMTEAGLYDALAELDTKLLEYVQVKGMNPATLPVIQKQIWDLVEKANLEQDLHTDRTTAWADFDSFASTVQDYLSELADTAVSKGLHVLGRPPDNEGLIEFIVQITRTRNGAVPSLRETVAGCMGLDVERLLAVRGSNSDVRGSVANAQALNAVNETCRAIARLCVAGEPLPEQWRTSEFVPILAFIKDSLIPKLGQTTREMEAIIAALAGRFVPPGGSGNPTRGQADILPTGCNFFSIDPQRMPTATAWQVGVAMAEKLIERHRAETGGPLETLGMVLWGSNEFRNYGEDVAQALYLMGVKPTWEQNGRVAGLEIIPAPELMNPRVDITFRISGFFRDGLPNIVELLDEAVLMVAVLEEEHSVNIVRSTVVREQALLVNEGMNHETAFREASFRLFGCPPGAYGAGVSDAIHAQAWQTSDDLGEVFINWGGFAYGKGVYGVDKRDTFRTRLGQLQTVIKNEDNREHDLFSSDDFNSFFGGLIAAVKREKGSSPLAFSGDSSDMDRVKYRTLGEEVQHIFRSRLLNPKWIDSMIEHGFKGAGDLSRTVDFAFAWDATSQVIEDWMYQELAEKYALDPKMQQWFKQVNPHALHNIAERLLESIRRGMWQADEPLQRELENLYLDVEGDVEEFTE